MILGIDEARSYAEMVAAVQPRLITSESESDEVQRISAAAYEASLDMPKMSRNQETINRLRSLAESLLATVDELERSYIKRM
jgi:hypothetical protein